MKLCLLIAIFLINTFSTRSFADACPFPYAFPYVSGDISISCSNGSHLVEDVYHAGHFLRQNSDTIGVTRFENHYDTKKFEGKIDYKHPVRKFEAKPGDWQMMVDENSKEIQLNRDAGLATGPFLVRLKLTGSIYYSLEGSAKQACSLKVCGKPDALYINSSPDPDGVPIQSAESEPESNIKK